ncbi:hypothetical protein [Crossiella sp. CA198]|uniref:hypothetical protein n=1 Tax=Crossiella sp. CA198 TaxID=3455607 RepID=UPI003F8D7992
MDHAGLSRPSIPLVITTALLLLGTPALAHPADADITCTAAAVAGTSTGLTMAGPAKFEITVAPTTAGCTDKRKDIAPGGRITGALITVPTPGTGRGNCGELDVKVSARLAWIHADGSPGAATELDAELTLRGTELSAEAEVSGGELAGYRVSGDLANRSQLQEHLTAACATEAGAASATALLTLGFSNKPWGR